MTKKDYAAIAAVINGATILLPDAANNANAERAEAYMEGAQDQINEIVRRLADLMQADNPRFDRERFLKACGIEE